MLKLIISTTTKITADKIAQSLISKKLAACVNIVPSVKSFFYSENKIACEDEAILFIKTNPKCCDTLIKFLKEIHPYDIPEILTFDVDNVNDIYLNWLNNFLDDDNNEE